MNDFSETVRRAWREQLERQVEQRIRYLGSEKPDPSLTVGMTGTALYVDDQPALVVRWDNGATLSLLPGVDRWERTEV